MDTIAFIESYIHIVFLIGFWITPLYLYMQFYRLLVWYYHWSGRRNRYSRIWLTIDTFMKTDGQLATDRMPRAFRLPIHARITPFWGWLTYHLNSPNKSV